jgi:hypothetical protein
VAGNLIENPVSIAIWVFKGDACFLPKGGQGWTLIGGNIQRCLTIRNHDPPKSAISNSIPDLVYDFSNSQIPAGGWH